MQAAQHSFRHQHPQKAPSRLELQVGFKKGGFPLLSEVLKHERVPWNEWQATGWTEGMTCEARTWSEHTRTLLGLLSFPVALKSPGVIEIPSSLLSLLFQGFGITRYTFGTPNSLCFCILPHFREAGGVSVDRSIRLVIPPWALFSTRAYCNCPGGL